MNTGYILINTDYIQKAYKISAFGLHLTCSRYTILCKCCILYQ